MEILWFRVQIYRPRQWLNGLYILLKIAIRNTNVVKNIGLNIFVR